MKQSPSRSVVGLQLALGRRAATAAAKGFRTRIIANRRASHTNPAGKPGTQGGIDDARRGRRHHQCDQRPKTSRSETPSRKRRRKWARTVSSPSRNAPEEQHEKRENGIENLASARVLSLTKRAPADTSRDL